MLKGLNPLLTPELLYALAQMGHGDTLAVVDRNFPAYAYGKRVINLAGSNVVDAAQAIFSLMPLDSFVPKPVARMEVVGDPEAVPEVHADFISVAAQSAGRHIDAETIERHAFYARTTDAFAVVTTGEERPYGCFLAAKGVLPEIVPK